MLNIQKIIGFFKDLFSAPPEPSNSSDVMTNTYPIYFSLAELIYSDTAKSKGIDNTPTFEIVDNLKELAFFLDDMRQEWGSGIRVCSGYRCDELNSAVGGVSNSEHRLGWAADLQPSNGKMFLFKEFVVKYLKGKKYSQCIIEKSGKTEWIHFSLYGVNKSQRCQCFKIEN